MERRKPSRCPKCGQGNVVPVHYGEPLPEAEELAEARLVILGGCCVTDDAPKWGCTTCGARWRSKPAMRS